MQIHGSCASKDGAGVLVLGPPGSGKSDLVLRLLDRGFVLVADDQVEIEGRHARAPSTLAGLLEVRGLGLMRLSYAESAELTLIVELTEAIERLPRPTRHATFGLPVVRIDPRSISAAHRVDLALACARGQLTQVAGAFAA